MPTHEPADEMQRPTAVAGLAVAILHDTSDVLHHDPVGRHVGAALELFASVALMSWYVLRIFINRD